METRVSPVDLLKKMKELKSEVYKEGMELFNKHKDNITNQDFLDSALNLCFYLSLRSRDITDLQKDLSLLGLSSLGRLESRTMETLDAVICSLGKIANEDVDIYCYPPKQEFVNGKEKLERNAEALFGEFPEHRNTMIMVTLSNEMKYDDVEDLISRGMNVARINCAHDNEELWIKLANFVNKASHKLNKSCKIMTDIAGPKVRIRWILSSKDKNKMMAGDKLLLSNSDVTFFDPFVPTKVGCSIPEIISELKVDETILFDDGSIEGKVTEIVPEGVIIQIEKVVKDTGVRLKVDKGINFPNSDIKLNIITEKDEKDLDFMAQYADIIAVSFISTPDDINYAIEKIKEKTPSHRSIPPIIAKIETTAGLTNLPAIIMAAAGKDDFGIMIARGDLAIELGYLRFAELQQEILWICESADIPVIWATQVLESMAKSGIPSRAEVTDAAEGGARSECVMLNKGKYIPEVVTFLDQLLGVMKSNVYKKSPKLRALNLAKNVFKNR